MFGIQWSYLQCGFRSKRCTTDHLVRLETVIREAVNRNEHLPAIFFDMEKLYRSLIRSKLDYGSFIYQSARRTYLRILNPICHGGIRLVLGAFRTSPVESLYAEADEAPANIRSSKLATQYYAKLKSCPSNPVYNAAFHPRYRELFEKREKTIQLFDLRMISML